MKKKQKKQKKKKLNTKKVIIIIFIVMIAILIIINNNQIKYKKEITLVINNEIITQKLKEPLIIKEDSIYIELEDIKENFEQNIYQEDENIILAGDTKITVINLENDKIEINGSIVQIKGKPYKTEKNRIYLPISDLEKTYNMECTYIPQYKNIVIDYYDKKLEKALTTKTLLLRSQPKTFSDALEKIEKESNIIYISEENGWAKIRTLNGNIGYVKKKYLKNFIVERENFEKNLNEHEADYTIDISNEKIEKYENRKELIEKILTEAVEKEKKAIKISYNKDKNEEKYKRFIIESKAMLKECGIFLDEK